MGSSFMIDAPAIVFSLLCAIGLDLIHAYRWTHSWYRGELCGVDHAAESIAELQKGDELGDLLELRGAQAIGVLLEVFTSEFYGGRRAKQHISKF